jgi:hypothetical protein
MEITDSEETAKAEAAKLDREAERTYQAEQNMRRNSRDQGQSTPKRPDTPAPLAIRESFGDQFALN